MPHLVVGTSVSSEVESVVRGYPHAEVTGVRWSVPAQWIVTVREVGDVSSETATAMTSALRTALQGLPKATATLAEARREGGIVIDVTGLEPHTSAVFDATAPILPVLAGAPRNARVVVARGRVPKELVQPVPSVSWLVGELVLLAARRTGQEPGFDVLETFPLA